jgi:hypothetical protein
MKYVKILGLLAVAAGAMMAFAGAASATVATSPAGTPYTGKIHATSVGHAILHGPLGIEVQCNSTVEGTISSHGAGVTVKGTISSLTFTNCTNGYAVSVLNKGSLEAHTDPADPAGTSGNGTLTSTGAEVTVSTPLGFNCLYKTNATDIGTLTGSKTTKGNAVLDITAAIPRSGHSAFCGGSGEWTGSYKVNTPGYFDISS